MKKILLLAFLLVGCEKGVTTPVVEAPAQFAGCDVQAIETHNKVYRGTLESKDCDLRPGLIDLQIQSVVDYFEFTLKVETFVGIGLAGTEFDTFLVVWDRDGQLLGYSDNRNGFGEPFLGGYLGPGAYIVGVMSLDDGHGQYHLIMLDPEN